MNIKEASYYEKFNEKPEQQQILELELAILKKELELLNVNDCKRSPLFDQIKECIEDNKELFLLENNSVEETANKVIERMNVDIKEKNTLTYQQKYEINGMLALLKLGEKSYSTSNPSAYQIDATLGKIIEIIEKKE